MGDAHSEFLEAAQGFSEEREGLIQRMVVRRMVRRGIITVSEGDEVLRFDFVSFIEYILKLIEHADELIAIIERLIAIFMRRKNRSD